MKNAVNVALVCGLLAGCAEAPEKITPNYISPVQYSNLDCDQIRSEMLRVAGHVRILVGQQHKKHRNDQWAMGVGLVVAWPALFFLMGGDQKEELAELKGEYDALDAAAVQRKCAVAEEIRAVRAPTTPAAAVLPVPVPAPIIPVAARTPDPAAPAPIPSSLTSPLLEKPDASAIRMMSDYRTVLGITLADPLAKHSREQSASNVVSISSIIPGSLADRSGLKRGDWLMGMGDRVIASADDLDAAIRALPTGALVRVSIIRGGDVLSLSIQF